MATLDKNTHFYYKLKHTTYKTVGLSSNTVAIISLIHLSKAPNLQSINFKTVPKLECECHILLYTL